MLLSKLTAVLAPKLFGLFMVAAVIGVIVYSNKKMKKLKEQSRQRELDFMSSQTELLLASRQFKNEKQNDENIETISMGTTPMEAQELNNHKMVVLDGYVLNPGDLTWEGFEKYGEITVYDRTAKEDVVSRMQGADIVITNKTVITKEIMQQCTDLKYIGVIATGYNVVDVVAAKELGIIVTNVPGYGTDAVAQFTFALMLEMCNQVGAHAKSVMEGGWSNQPDFSYCVAPLMDLKGKTLGIVGYGSIGSRVAEIAIAFGMEVLLYSRTKKPANFKAKWVTLDELLEKSDIVTLHCPLTKNNEKMMNAEAFSKMKDGAKLINTARGGLIDEQAFVDALSSGKLSSAALDVISEEPMSQESILYNAKNLIVTPHIAWASHEARERLMNIAVDNVQKFLEGKPQNNVAK